LEPPYLSSTTSFCEFYSRDGRPIFLKEKNDLPSVEFIAIEEGKNLLNILKLNEKENEELRPILYLKFYFEFRFN